MSGYGFWNPTPGPGHDDGPALALEAENERLRALLQSVLPFAEQAHVTAEYRPAWNRIIAAARDACRLSSETTT